MALILIGLFIMGVVVVLIIAWSRPDQPSGEPGPWTNEERPPHEDVFSLEVALGLGALGSLPLTFFTSFTTYSCRDGSDGEFICSEIGRQLVWMVPSFGMFGSAVLGAIGALVVGKKARPGWLRACLAGQVLALIGSFALMAV